MIHAITLINMSPGKLFLSSVDPVERLHETRRISKKEAKALVMAAEKVIVQNDEMFDTIVLDEEKQNIRSILVPTMAYGRSVTYR